jgi:hypothetical protein
MENNPTPFLMSALVRLIFFFLKPENVVFCSDSEHERFVLSRTVMSFHSTLIENKVFKSFNKKLSRAKFFNPSMMLTQMISFKLKNFFKIRVLNI